MFVPPLKIGDVITNHQLTELFGVANMGGMRYSRAHNVLVLISNHHLKRENPYLNPYDDKWIDGVLHYTGMGNKGDQSKYFAQNKRLFHGDYEALYLFEVSRKGEYTYIGPVEKAGEMYMSRQPDVNGIMRKVCVFPIRKI